MFASLAFFEFFLIFFTYLERTESLTVPGPTAPVRLRSILSSKTSSAMEGASIVGRINRQVFARKLAG